MSDGEVDIFLTILNILMQLRVKTVLNVHLNLYFIYFVLRLRPNQTILIKLGAPFSYVAKGDLFCLHLIFGGFSFFWTLCPVKVLVTKL